MERAKYFMSTEDTVVSVSVEVKKGKFRQDMKGKLLVVQTDRTLQTECQNPPREATEWSDLRESTDAHLSQLVPVQLRLIFGRGAI